MKKISILFLTFILFIFCCAKTQTSPTLTSPALIVPLKSQLQIREFQTKDFDTDDVGMVMKAMVNVLQDDGFTIQNVDTEIGILTALKEIMIYDAAGHKKFLEWDRPSSCLFSPSFLQHDPSCFRVNTSILATINITKFGNQTRARASFQQKVIEDTARKFWISLNSGPIEDEKYYQEFFSKVDKGIFIQKENL